jgi:hypothetical protein
MLEPDDVSAMLRLNERMSWAGARAGLRGSAGTPSRRIWRRGAESRIHHPTDSTLLGDGVRVLTRTMI